MRVMVTGGTGFVGAHTVKAIVDAGHDVTLLVRDVAKIETNVGTLGVDAARLDHVVGDMGDAGAVNAALDGADAVVHAAAVVALERRRAAEILAANPHGARTVIGAALERSIDPVVHVSSLSALFVPGVELVHADLPPTDSQNPYARSKAEAEIWVRERQAEGAPIAITYPGGVVGPAAGSAVGEMAGALVTHLAAGVVPVRDGALSIIDARDLGAIHAALLVAGHPARRFVCGGHYVTMDDLAAMLRTLTGRRFPVLPIPASVLRGVGAAMDTLMRVVPIDSMFTAEAMTMLTQWAPTDDALVRDQLGIELRPTVDTLRDAFRSLYANGHATRRHLGRLAASGPRP